VLSDYDIANGVLEDDAVPGLANLANPSGGFREWASSNFFWAGRLLARINERHTLPDLPAGIDPVCDPHRAVRFRKRRLAARGLAIRMIVRAWRQRRGRHASSTPDG
jgi:hypothetical protein